ncbi:ribonuclease P protein subunit p40-like [Corticium candelabrum]|uniref:ribonuclease P protein subunit p40-like n=1 Tax=Corticium candelabrum TaxID=121492 RepID=UPI002E25638A|nr:ribonuclease P protein subunit p40-like [Corticium candelabrum]
MAAYFKPPKSHLVFESFHGTDKLSAYISEHTFNHAVNIFLPGQARIPRELLEVSPGKDCFYVAELPVSTFIQPHFIHSTLKQGSFFALSHTHHIDTDDCVAVFPQGLLVLSVTKDTYEQLGIVGRSSEFQQGAKFIVEIDLLADSFQPGRKQYERVQWCLTDRLSLTMPFLMAFIPRGSSATSSIPVLQDMPHKELTNKETLNTLTNIQIPSLSYMSPQISLDHSSNEYCSAIDLFEWLGAISCNIDCDSGQPDGFVSAYSCPMPNRVVPLSCNIGWRGVITPQRILQLINILSKCEDALISWCVISVWGFADCPFSWGQQEHGYYMAGENHYTCVLFPQSNQWFFTALGTHDKVR